MAFSSRRADFWNLSTLYGSLGLNAAINLIMIGYLARTLGPEQWGLVLLTQAFGYLAAIIPEYGFSFSATRDLAQAGARKRMADIAVSVVCAKLLLGLLIVPAAVVAYYLIPSFQLQPSYLIGGAVFAVAFGLDTGWLFLGVERQYIYALATSCARMLTLFLVVFLVKGPTDGWSVMLFQALGALLVFLVGLIFIRYRLPTTPVLAASIWGAIRGGWHMFHYRAAQGLTLNSSVLLLGIVSPASVNIFGSADRIMRNWIGLLGPIASAGLPRIAKLVGRDVLAARKVAFLTTGVTIIFGLVSGAAILAFTAPIIEVILGPGYESVIPVLRVAACALPLAAASNMLAVQWLIPFGLDTPLVRITFAAGTANAIGCLALGYWLGALGAAIAILVMEAAMVGSFLYVLRKAFKRGRTGQL